MTTNKPPEEEQSFLEMLAVMAVFVVPGVLFLIGVRLIIAYPEYWGDFFFWGCMALVGIGSFGRGALLPFVWTYGLISLFFKKD